MKLSPIQEDYINKKIEKLSKSKFRSSFHLTKNMILYIKKIGWSKIEEHCSDFIEKRLAPYPIPNDGKQTPTKSHPVFIAQHATATCCRSCLQKWHNIPKNRELNTKEKKFIQALIIEWIRKELEEKVEKR